jgi:hypothetical protein
VGSPNSELRVRSFEVVRTGASDSEMFLVINTCPENPNKRYKHCSTSHVALFSHLLRSFRRIPSDTVRPRRTPNRTNDGISDYAASQEIDDFAVAHIPMIQH